MRAGRRIVPEANGPRESLGICRRGRGDREDIGISRSPYVMTTALPMDE